MVEKFAGFFASLATREGIIAIVVVILVCAALVMAAKKKGSSLSTRSVVAIGIGAALYGAVSAIAIPIGPDTSFRIAVALLVIFGAIFGPTVGFLVGFIGHALNDAFMYGSVWWSWVFLSAMMGLFGGLVALDDDFDVLAGKVTKKHYIKLYVYSFIGMLAGSIVAYFGDVFLYGEPAAKVWLQIILANISNFAVIAVVGIPVVIALAKMRGKGNGLRLED